VDRREIELETEMKKAQLESNQNDKIRKHSSQVYQKKQQKSQKNTKRELMELKKKVKRMEKEYEQQVFVLYYSCSLRVNPKPLILYCEFFNNCYV